MELGRFGLRRELGRIFAKLALYIARRSSVGALEIRPRKKMRLKGIMSSFGINSAYLTALINAVVK